MSIAALVAKMLGLTEDTTIRRELENILGMLRAAGLSDKPASSLKLEETDKAGL